MRPQILLSLLLTAIVVALPLCAQAPPFGRVDNVLRPILVGKDTKMPDWVVLISTLGGMSLLGINGFVIGPLIAALFMSCWALLTRDKHGVSTQ